MANASALFHRLNHVLESRRVSEIRIEALTALTAAVLCFLIIFGSWRRWCTHWLIQKGLMVAYFMSFSLATYTIGLMQSAALKVEVYPIWAVCFLIVFGCSNSITAYSVDDHKQVFRQVSQYIIYVVYVALILYSVADGVSFIVVCVMLVITLVKVHQRIAASMTVVASKWITTRVIADYMDSEHETRGDVPAPYNPVSMTGYRYLVDLGSISNKAAAFKLEAPCYVSSVNDSEVITIDKIWREGGDDDGPIGRSIGRDCKDVCLSYALFLLLTRRWFGYSCGESKQKKTRDLVFDGLLRDKDGQMGYERAFKVIETELAFMYDLFFTKYATIGSRGMAFWALASVASMLSVMALTVMRAMGIVPAAGGNGSRVLVAKATVADATITILILAALALLEVVELVLYWTSDWGRVGFACQYVSQPALRSGRKLSCSMRMKAFLSRVTLFSSSKYYWRHQLGQYSLFQSIGHGKANRCVVQTANICFKISRIVGLGGGFVVQTAVSKKALDPVELTAEVKRSVVLSLKRTGGRLTNGTSSLKYNGCSQLSWACSPGFCYSAHSPRDREKDTQTPVILIWHIATCYCEMAMAASRSGCRSDDNTELHIAVATKLSRYCAYLIVAAPKLLPGYKYDTIFLFHAVAREAVNVLAGAEDKYEAMRNLDVSTENNIFKSGAKLGKELEAIEDATLRWKVMADFGAEMMLYVSPSDNAKDHVERLAQGGEFITHLWALLFHAGIVNRDNQHDTVVLEHVDGDRCV